MKNKKFSAFAKFATGTGKMEFSNSIERLKKIILIDTVTSVVIFDQKNNRKLMTLTSKIHI